MNAPEEHTVPKGIVGRFLWAFHPASLPVLARTSYRLELSATLLFSFALAMVEGGVIGVFTKNTFEGHVRGTLLDYAAGLVAAAGEIANLASFVWAVSAHGKARVKFINTLQITVVSLIFLLAFIPRNEIGLLLLVLFVVAARICWSGIITIRPSIWHANYARGTRAKIVGNFAAVQVVVVAIMGLALGMLMDVNSDAFRIVLPICACIGLGAFFAFRQIRVRGEHTELKTHAASPKRPRLIDLVHVLTKDKFFAQFQACMFVLGMGNLMVTPVLIIVLKERFHLGYFSAILITVGIIQLCTPLFIPMWARLLDRSHVVTFRSIHSWSFVAALIAFAFGAHFELVWIMYLGAVLQSIGLAGGSIAWNIGHHDFAPPNDTSRYMAVHVTLNGVRGLCALVLSVSGYHWLERRGLDRWGFDASTVMLIICCCVCITGACGFIWLRRSMGQARLAIARH